MAETAKRWIVSFAILRDGHQDHAITEAGFVRLSLPAS